MDDTPTLRDLFAMFALMRAYGRTPESTAQQAYLLADAMLKEREKK